MEQIELQATKREVIGKKVKQLRRGGWTPLVLLQNGEDSLPLKAQTQALNRVVRKAGMNRIIAVNIAGDDEPHQAIVKEIQRHPVSKNLLHIDLLPIVMGEKMRTAIPVQIVGQSSLVQDGDYVLMYGSNTIEIECLPKDLIHQIEVDAALLDEDKNTITVGDLDIPETITILAEPEEVLLSVATTRAVAEEEEEAEEELLMEEAYSPDAVEVISKGKEEEEEFGEEEE